MGDDEQIVVRLDDLGNTVNDVFFCIHIYSKGAGGRPKTFRDVANPYCRVAETGGDELCRYTLVEAGNRSGLIIARLRRSADGRWGFHALGAPSAGTMYKDSIPDMQRMSQIEPKELQMQLRTQTTMTSQGGTAQVIQTPLVPEKAGSEEKCCALQ